MFYGMHWQLFSNEYSFPCVWKVYYSSKLIHTSHRPLGAQWKLSQGQTEDTSLTHFSSVATYQYKVLSSNGNTTQSRI